MLNVEYRMDNKLHSDEMLIYQIGLCSNVSEQHVHYIQQIWSAAISC